MEKYTAWEKDDIAGVELSDTLNMEFEELENMKLDVVSLLCLWETEKMCKVSMQKVEQV